MKEKNKNTEKKILIIILVFILVSSVAISLVSAQVDKTDFSTPSFWGKIFTIVGQDTNADVNATETFTTNYGETFTRSISQTRALCNGNSGLWDIFDIQGTAWNEAYEAIDYVNYHCPTYNTGGCVFELYCMPYTYPPTNSICDDWQNGYIKKTKNELDTYMPLYNFYTNQIVTQYSYCVAPEDECANDEPIDCWGKNTVGGCDKRTYECTYSTYPNCPSTYPYTSSGSCTGAITTADKTCSQNGGYVFFPSVQSCTGNGGTIIPSVDTQNCCSIDIPDPLACTSFTYTAWSECVNRYNNRTILTRSPSGCNSDLNAVLAKKCGDTIDGGTTSKDSMSWSTFYSIDNDDFMDQSSACAVSSDCEPLEGYNVSCVISGSDHDIYLARMTEYYQESCSRGGLMKMINGISNFLFGTNQCELISGGITWFKQFWSANVTGTPGFCIAESTTWYGKVWDSILKMMGGLGIPYAYVFMASIGILLLIVVLIISKI